MALELSPTLTWGRFVDVPEAHLARTSLEAVVEQGRHGRQALMGAPVLLHGPTGTGKSHLVTGLALAFHRPGTTLLAESAAGLGDLVPIARPKQFKSAELADAVLDTATTWREQASACDLLLVEDLQHLPARAVELLIYILDARQAADRPTVLTANAGPRHLQLRGEPAPARLTSRLAAGLVVGLAPWGPASRRRLLGEFAQRRQLAVSGDILDWLAQRLIGGGRQLDGAVGQLETLAKLQPRALTLADVEPHFQPQIDATRPSLERIVERVGECFAIPPKHLQSRRRTRNIVLPRQVTMYLARRLTRHSLQDIGAYLGGHDHTTVLHACRKIEAALAEDAGLSGAVQHLQAELT